MRRSVGTLKARWSADTVALEQARRDLADARAAHAAEREARVTAQSAAEAAIAQRVTLEAVFAKWEIPRPPAADARASR